MIYSIKTFALFVSASLFSSILLAQIKKNGTPHGPGDDIYKHYKGTIGSRNVVLDLVYGFQGSSNYGGSYYYFTDSLSTQIFYIQQPKSLDHKAALHADVLKENSSLDELRSGSTATTWEFRIADSILSGHINENGQTHKIQLKEDYTNSIAFSIDAFKKDTVLRKNEAKQAKAEIIILGLKAQGTNETNLDFIHRELLKFLEEGKTSYKNIGTGYQAYIQNWLKTSVEKLKTTGNDVKSIRKTVLLRPIYNDHKFIVFKKTVYGSDEDAISFLLLDIKNKKKLDLKDILTVDNTKLQALLETALRKKYHLESGKKLSTWLTIEQMKVSNKIFLTHKGISFYYDPGDIHENEIVLHLDFIQLRPMLKKDMASRMKE